MKEIILKIEYGGLGDHLFFSPLPRLLKKYNIADKIFLSSQSVYRSKETYSFVWQENPYLDGISDKPATKINRDLAPKIDNIMNIIAAHYGLESIDYELSPEVYLTPNYSDKYAQHNYMDLNYISFTGAFYFLDEIKLIRKYNNYILVNPKKYLIPFILKRYIRTINFNDYLSLVYSSRSFACLTSGGASLAAAYNKKALVFYGYGHPHTNRHSTNNNIFIGSENFFRKLLSRILFKINTYRLLLQKSK